ncbi:hypothetical protein B7486_19780 [cyanobacterium TDX16]|nr:hypothetical protein B7486_19780 [cyanobacterium TDX16]
MIRRSQVRYSETPPDAAWKIRLAVLALMTLTQSACLLPIPLAIYPEIKPGSATTIEVCDQFGKPIKTEGLLIIYRDYLVGGITGAPSNSIIHIRNGKATIPIELAISSTGCIVGITPSLYGLIPFGFPITDSHTGKPTVIVLVPGSNAVVRYWLETEEHNPMRIRLVTNPATQADSWREILASLRGRYDKPGPGKQLDLRFDHYHYWKARNFIEAELDRLGAEPGVAESASAKTEPSSAPARNSTRP